MRKEITSVVTFQFFDNEEFRILFELQSEDGKITGATESALSFLSFLKELRLVKSNVEPYEWFNNCNGLTIKEFSSSNKSLKIRLKANQLGLKCIPGKSFEQKREEDCKNARKKSFSIQAAIN